MTRQEEDQTFVNDSGSNNVLYLIHADNELFNEEDNIAARLLRVKRTESLRKGENWEIMENQAQVLIMRGTRFTKKEKEFLRTVDGFNFVLLAYKNGNQSVVKIKEQLKKRLKEKAKKRKR